MLRISFFAVAFIIIGGSETISILSLSQYDVIHVINNHNSCSMKDAERWANVFVNCFGNTKSILKSRRDMFNIVERLLDHSKRCIKFSTLQCRPNYDGFLNIMGKVIEMIKEYCNMHVERLMNDGIIAYAERADKIIDLNCVEKSFTKDIYAVCFNRVLSAYEHLGENETDDLIYQKEVEMAILCTNAAERQCSKFVKMYLNKIVRYILGVKQPERETMEDDRMHTKLPKDAETPKPKSELRKKEKGNVDDDFEILKLSDSTRHPEPTEFSEAEKDKLKRNFKNANPSKSNDFTEGKNDDEFADHTKSFKFTKTFIFSEQTTILDLTKSEKEVIMNEPKITENLELTETSTLPEHSKIGNFTETLDLAKSSTSLNARKGDNNTQFTEPLQPLKITKLPKVNDLLNSTNFDDSKDLDVAETEKEVEIDTLNWKVQSTVPTEFETRTEQFKASTHLNPGKKDKDLQFTEPPEPLKDIVPSKLKDLAHSTALDSTGETIVTDAREDTITIVFAKEISTSTKFPKIIELLNTSESTKPSMTTAFTEPPTSSKHAKTTTFAKPPKPTELQKTTTSTKSPVTTERPRTTASTKPPKPIVNPRTTTTRKPPKPTELPKTTTTRKPPKPTELPKTTSTRKPRRSSSEVRSRSRGDPPRPTEAPTRPWYDFIVRPFVSLWRTIKSWFGW